MTRSWDESVTHTASSVSTTPPGSPPVSMVLTTTSLTASMRITVPSLTLVTQTSVSVATMPRGPRPTETGWTPVSSMWDTVLSSMLATQTAVSVAETFRGPSPTSKEFSTWLVAGSMRSTVSLSKSDTQTPAELASMPAGSPPSSMVSTTVLVAGSMRSTVVRPRVGDPDAVVGGGDAEGTGPGGDHGRASVGVIRIGVIRVDDGSEDQQEEDQEDGAGGDDSCSCGEAGEQVAERPAPEMREQQRKIVVTWG